MSSKNTFLWRISSDHLSTISYLFGTMHVQDLRAFSNLQLIQEKIAECKSFAAEFHLDQTSDMAAQKMVLPEGVTLKELIPQKKYVKTRRILLKATGLDIDFFIQTSPFLLTGLIGSQLLGKEMPQSLDEYLWNFAKSNSKNLLGIETFEEQMEVLEKIPLQTQVKMLIGLSSNIKNFRKHTFHLAELYQKGEFQRLSKSVKKNAKGLRKLLLYHRNEVMAERIFELVKSESLFAAIGAGHLGGAKGVIRLLKKRGLTVKPIAF